jgi:hypothetical protein
MDKHSSLLRKFVNYGQKKFYNIEAKLQSYLALWPASVAQWLTPEVEGSNPAAGSGAEKWQQ